MLGYAIHFLLCGTLSRSLALPQLALDTDIGTDFDDSAFILEDVSWKACDLCSLRCMALTPRRQLVQ